MEVMNSVIAAGSGGILGLAGTLLGRVATFFERRQAFRQEQAKWKHETDLHKLNMQAEAARSEQEIRLADTQGSWTGLSASIGAETALASNPNGSQWVLDFLRLVRPLITFILWLLVWRLSASGADAATLNQTIFIASSATLWWFGDRAPKQPVKVIPQVGAE